MKPLDKLGTNGSSLLVALAVLVAAPAWAGDRPGEDEMFGAPAAEPAAAPAAPDGAGRPEEAALFGEPAAESRPASSASTRSEESSLFEAPEHKARAGEDASPEDPLKIGGQFYMRAAMTGTEKAPPSKWLMSAPTLLDAYFDARPNERVRGFVLGRLRYDPTVAETQTATGSAISNAGYGSARQLQIDLDQLWLRFDIERTVFITAGRQHVKWGPARFWNPTDFLHQVRRDPLAVFDSRVGTTMVKLHVPIESLGWNFYGVGLLEDVSPADSLGQLGAAARAEFVFGEAEFGASAIVHRGKKPKFGLDVSAGVGPFDVYAEASFRKEADAPLYRRATIPDLSHGLDGLLEAYQPEGTTIGATAGANWSVKYNDEDVFMLGAEYFYNSAGYEDSELYPLLIAKGAFTPFYLGQHYLGVYGVLMGPGSWNNTNFTVSNLSNLSDGSHIGRLDYSVLILTHLRFEAYGAVQYGKTGGEFHFGLDMQAPDGQGGTTRVFLPAPRLQAGVGLRVAI